MKSIVIIPCFNDNKTINVLLEKILSSNDIDVLVIDDGSYENVSIDNSRDNVILLKNETNMGKGFSLKKAFKYAFEKDYTHTVTIDADMQHDPKFIPHFIDVNEGVDIVVGSRDFNGTMPFYRRLSNRLTSKIISVLVQKKILDSQSGYRRYKLEKRIYENSIENGFQFESEVLIDELRNKNSRLIHIPIPTIYNNEKSSIKNILDTYKFLKLIIRKIFD